MREYNFFGKYRSIVQKQCRGYLDTAIRNRRKIFHNLYSRRRRVVAVTAVVAENRRKLPGPKWRRTDSIRVR